MPRNVTVCKKIEFWKREHTAPINLMAAKRCFPNNYRIKTSCSLVKNGFDLFQIVVEDVPQ